jgi:hypothetical protein
MAGWHKFADVGEDLHPISAPAKPLIGLGLASGAKLLIFFYDLVSIAC